MDEHNRGEFLYESTHSRMVTIIKNVSVTFENLPVVWIT